MIMNSKSFRMLTFVCLMTTILLLSLILGSSLLAKPNNPNKPDNPGEHETTILSDFKIWIGNGDLGSPEDFVLRPYGDPPIDYLVKEDWPYWEPDWLPYTKKGKNQNMGSWNINLMSDFLPWQPTSEYCGTYDIANKLGGPGYEEVALFDTMVAHGFSNDLESHQIILEHIMPKRERVGDFWRFHIGWPVEDPYKGLWLHGNTNEDAEWEGVYDQNTDTWTVPFDSAWFELILAITDENTGESVVTILWEGPLSFTIEIQRALNE